MILSASGGLVYHARAAFTRIESLLSVSGEDRWAPTRRCVSTHVGRWLALVKPETLILFGPSAGYLLEKNFFATVADQHRLPNFKIVAVDPDPLAAFLFRRRFSKSTIEWQTRHDLLPFDSARPSAFAEFLHEVSRPSSKTAVLFLGLLGQLPLHAERATRPAGEARRILLHKLSGFDWASLHDLESTTLNRGLSQLPPGLRPEDFAEPSIAASLTSTEARASWASKRLQALGVGPELWIDHETEWLGSPDVVIPWLLSPRRFHQLGFSKTSIVVTD